MTEAALRERRTRQLAQHAYATGLLPPDQVQYDFSTDSWNQLNQPYMRHRMQELANRQQGAPLELQTVLARHFPFSHFIATPRGRDAENLLFSACADQPGLVLQNVLFHTARIHQQQNALVPFELPAGNAFSQDAFRFKGNIDLEKLVWMLGTHTVSLIYIEALGNGAGGHPLSMENLRAVATLARRHDIRLYLDATRAVENCVLIRDYEPGYAQQPIDAVLQEFYNYCDGITLSAVKDYGVTVGGVLATRSDTLYQQALWHCAEQQLFLKNVDAGLLAQSINDDDYIYREVRQRILNVRQLGSALSAAHYPVRTPYGGHCIILDLSDLPGMANDARSIAAFMAGLYEDTGMRGARHWDGLAPEYRRPGWLRLAVPLACPYIDDYIAVLGSRKTGITPVAL